MGKKLNVAIIGQGRSGRDIHGKYFLTDEAKELWNIVAVVDRNPDRLARAKELWNCDTYAEYPELFGRTDIDLVVNSTYSNDHPSVSIDLLRHGFNVVSEKPFARYGYECEQVIAAAKESGKMFTIFQQSHFVPYITKIHEVLDSGLLGKAHHISIKFSGFARRWDWQCSKRMYGGSLLNTGPHPFEHAITFLDTDDMPNVFSVLKRINSAGDAEDYVKCILTYPDRPLIDIEIVSQDAFNDRIYDIYCERGSIKCSGSKITYKYHDEKPMPELQLTPLMGPDGISPAYCSEKLEWHTVEEPIVGNAFNVGSAMFYQNIYNHLTAGEPLVIRPEKIKQLVQIMELIHAQNPMEMKY